MPNTFRSGIHDNGGEFSPQPDGNITDDDDYLVPNDNSNQPVVGPSSTVNNGSSLSLLATQSHNVDAFGNYSDFLNSNVNLTTTATNQQHSAGSRHETPGFWDLRENEDYVPIEEQRILRTVPQSPEDIDTQLEDLNN